jgi:methanethiol S-methyltransferase
MVALSPITHERPSAALVYAWSGAAVMWGFWVSFVIFLTEPRALISWWPLPTIDRTGAATHSLVAAIVDLGLVVLFGLQHSMMARPWFKERVIQRMPGAFERCTYVHMANLALFALIMLWQPIPIDVWRVDHKLLQQMLWVLFAGGWVILFFGAWSFGIGELLGLPQMRAWQDGRPPPATRLKTGRLYRWLRHPMYVGVLLGVWATPRMSIGHLLLALGLTGYVLIAMRYEERDLLQRFGARYGRWRGITGLNGLSLSVRENLGTWPGQGRCGDTSVPRERPDGR